MKQQKISMYEQLLLPLSIIVIAALMRLIPHPANVAPIAAMALFGGMYVNKKYALIIPLFALLLSDFFIGFYQGMPFIYGSFFLIGMLGLVVRKYLSPQVMVASSLGSSLFFFLITNFGVWLMGSMYPKTITGLMMSYTAALPFLRNSMLGDLLYLGIFVVGYKTLLLFIRSTEPASLPQKE